MKVQPPSTAPTPSYSDTTQTRLSAAGSRPLMAGSRPLSTSISSQTRFSPPKLGSSTMNRTLSTLPPPPSQKPNYHISLPSVAPKHPGTSMVPGNVISTSQPPHFPMFATNPPIMGALLEPLKPIQASRATSIKPSKDDWGDFDPLT